MAISHIVCVCVCVCVRERERERELLENKMWCCASTRAGIANILSLVVVG